MNTGNLSGYVNDSIIFPIRLINQYGDTIFLSKKENYIIDFWFVGCSPCVKFFPEWEKIVTQYDSSNYKFLSVCIPFSNEFSDSVIFKYPLKFGTHFEVHKAVYGVDSILGLQNYPTILVIKNNEIVFRGIPELFNVENFILLNTSNP